MRSFFEDMKDTLSCFRNGVTLMHPIIFQMKSLGYREVQCLIKGHRKLSARVHKNPDIYKR